MGIIPGVKGFGFEALLGGKEQKTRWEDLDDRRRRRIENNGKLEIMINQINENIRKAVLEGKVTAEARAQLRDTEAAKAACEDEIRMLEEEMAIAEPDHLRQLIQRFERRIGEINEGLQPFREAVTAAEEQLRKAEELRNRETSKVAGELDELSRQKESCRHRLEEIQQSGPRPSPLTTDEWLARLRKGMTSYLAGQYPELDEAIQTYEREKSEILAYNENRRRGKAVPAPECIKYYSKERLRALAPNMKSKLFFTSIDQ